MRDIKGAAALLLECVATFTCTELCSYKEFIFYAVITNVLSLPRTALKKRIIDGPEVLTIMPELPNARKLVESLYACEYRGFMEAMVEVNEEVRTGGRGLACACIYGDGAKKKFIPALSRGRLCKTGTLASTRATSSANCASLPTLSS
jgi:hypothetical protein